MGVKLENKYIKNKLKDKFGEIEIYNPQFDNNILTELTKLIANNSQTVQLENGKSDIQVDTIEIMRFMLINLSNIENADYWNSIDNIELEKMLDLVNGDFKKAINSLIDIMMEIGSDITLQSIRQLDLLQNKLNELVESTKANIKIDKTLSKLGLDKDKLIKLQNGDAEVMKEFQDNIIKSIETQVKPKRQYNKKKK
jgi:hypothetical protein